MTQTPPEPELFSEKAMTLEECILQAQEARKKATEAERPEARNDYTAIAETWEALAAGMKKSGIMVLPPLRKNPAKGD